MPWNIIMLVGLIGFALGLNSGFSEHRKREADKRYEESRKEIEGDTNENS